MQVIKMSEILKIIGKTIKNVDGDLNTDCEAASEIILEFTDGSEIKLTPYAYCHDPSYIEPKYSEQPLPCVCGHPKLLHDKDGRLGGKGCLAVMKNGICNCNVYRKIIVVDNR